MKIRPAEAGFHMLEVCEAIECNPVRFQLSDRIRISTNILS